MSGARKARYAKRRQRRMARVEHDLTDEQWAALQEAWGGCAYCGATDTTGRAMQRDCVLALSRGGRYTLGNVVPARPEEVGEVVVDTAAARDEGIAGTGVDCWPRRRRIEQTVGRFMPIEESSQ